MADRWVCVNGFPFFLHQRLHKRKWQGEVLVVGHGDVGSWGEVMVAGRRGIVAGNVPKCATQESLNRQLGML